jgi:hypothetical protein
MVNALELAMSKAVNLPEAAQEQLGRELLERIDELAHFRAETEIGVKDREAGLAEELKVEELIQELHEEYVRAA